MPDPADTAGHERFRALLARLLRVPKQEVLDKERERRRARRAGETEPDAGSGGEGG